MLQVRAPELLSSSRRRIMAEGYINVKTFVVQIHLARLLASKLLSVAGGGEPKRSVSRLGASSGATTQGSRLFSSGRRGNRQALVLLRNTTTYYIIDLLVIFIYLTIIRYKVCREEMLQERRNVRECDF